MDSRKASWNSRIIVAALSIIAFPFLIMVVFYASQALVPSLANIQFSVPERNVSVTSTSVHTIQRPVFNESTPAFLNFSFPGFPSITYSDLLILAAVVVVILACLQAFRVISARRSIRPVSDIDLLIEERNRVASIIDETVRKLNLGSNYRDTVLKCYKLIAEALEARSSVDGRALTASEFMKIVSERLKFNSANLVRATSLFEVARYSENEVTHEDAEGAIDCLSSLSSELKSMDVSMASGGDNIV